MDGEPRKILGVLEILDASAQEMADWQEFARARGFSSFEDFLLAFQNSPQMQELLLKKDADAPAIRRLFIQFVEDMAALAEIESTTADMRMLTFDLVKDDDPYGQKIADALGFESIEALQAELNADAQARIEAGEPACGAFETFQRMADARGINLHDAIFGDWHRHNAEENAEPFHSFEPPKEWDPTENEPDDEVELFEFDFSEELMKSMEAIATLLQYENAEALLAAYFNASGTAAFLATNPSREEALDALWDFFNWRCFELQLDPNELFSDDENNS